MGLGSGIRKKPIPDPGVKKAPDPGSGSATLHCTPTKTLRSNFKFLSYHVSVPYGFIYLDA